MIYMLTNETTGTTSRHESLNAALDAVIDEIGRNVTPGAHAIVLLDQAGWHTTEKLEIPKNLTLLPIPPASPELNAAENIWQIPAPDLSREPHLQRLRRDHRRLLRGLAQARSRNRPHSIDRYAKLGKHRSDSMKAGIILWIFASGWLRR